MSIFIERLSKQYQKELSKILTQEAKMDHLNSVTITEVRITNDLSFANIYYICPDMVREQVKTNLEHSKGYLRGQLASRISSRKAPELIFKYDEALEYGNHINELINEINKK